MKTIHLEKRKFENERNFLRYQHITFFSDNVNEINIIKVYVKGKLTEKIIFDK